MLWDTGGNSLSDNSLVLSLHGFAIHNIYNITQVFLALITLESIQVIKKNRNSPSISPLFSSFITKLYKWYRILQCYLIPCLRRFRAAQLFGGTFQWGHVLVPVASVSPFSASIIDDGLLFRIIQDYWWLLMIIDYWWLLMIIDDSWYASTWKNRKKNACFSKRCLFSESDMNGILFREGPYILDVRHHRDS